MFFSLPRYFLPPSQYCFPFPLSIKEQIKGQISSNSTLNMSLKLLKMTLVISAWLCIPWVEGLPYRPYVARSLCIYPSPKHACYLKKKSTKLQCSQSLQSHSKCVLVFVYSELQTRALGSPEFWCIHMYDLINAEAEILCIQKALRQRWFLDYCWN